ncbi:hypothetical protein IVB30_33330 [Bradyrhizobium sp. 200]|uniref:hypothetical protein n=1 Tax=Bradyrhizobium sp. 200 TaxID=2782665 RepID=UPI001FFEE94F|nr:hypothetical protein [Bradyrhizobium sp. 200]UPJ47990.1 hypothetical protein IVB30_33330 [Bradyrhizobium sp. 200]
MFANSLPFSKPETTILAYRAPHGAALCNEAIEGFDDRAAKAAMIAEAPRRNGRAARRRN